MDYLLMMFNSATVDNKRCQQTIDNQLKSYI